MNESEKLHLINTCERVSKEYNISQDVLFNHVVEKYINKNKQWNNITVEHIANKLKKKRTT
jgi:hypothetical protein